MFDLSSVIKQGLAKAKWKNKVSPSQIKPKRIEVKSEKNKK
jgi:hypothetical protein